MSVLVFLTVTTCSSLRKVSGRHHELVDRYICLTDDERYVPIVVFIISYLFSWIWLSEFNLSPGLYSHEHHDGCHMWNRICLPLREHLISYWPVLSFLCCSLLNVASVFNFVSFIFTPCSSCSVKNMHNCKFNRL